MYVIASLVVAVAGSSHQDGFHVLPSSPVGWHPPYFHTPQTKFEAVIWINNKTHTNRAKQRMLEHPLEPATVTNCNCNCLPIHRPGRLNQSMPVGRGLAFDVFRGHEKVETIELGSSKQIFSVCHRRPFT